MKTESAPTDTGSKNGRKPWLVAVGTGIRTVGQMTLESIVWLEAADKVLYVVADIIAEETVKRLNPRAESMIGLYAPGKHRLQSYGEMVDRILTSVRAGLNTCVALYGHPGVFAYPAHESIRRARSEGFSAWMLPGISAEDCLYADLGLDPADSGCQSYEATHFMLNVPYINPSSTLVLWQVGVIGHSLYQYSYHLSAMPMLLERLYRYYRPDHPVIVYEAAVLPGCEPVIKRIPLAALPAAGLSTSSTVCIPPAQPDPRMVDRLNVLYQDNRKL